MLTLCDIRHQRKTVTIELEFLRSFSAFFQHLTMSGQHQAIIWRKKIIVNNFLFVLPLCSCYVVVCVLQTGGVCL
jgi:hypothetical protein